MNAQLCNCPSPSCAIHNAQAFYLRQLGKDSIAEVEQLKSKLALAKEALEEMFNTFNKDDNFRYGEREALKEALEALEKLK